MDGRLISTKYQSKPQSHSQVCQLHIIIYNSVHNSLTTQ